MNPEVSKLPPLPDGNTNCPPHSEEINMLSKNYEAGFKDGMRFEAKHRLLSNDALFADREGEAIPPGFVLVPVADAELCATVCTQWVDLFVETPGMDKYERYEYLPCVEMLRDELRDKLRTVAASLKGEGNG